MDDANTANWLVVHKQSSIDLKYTLKDNSNEVKNYNNTYIDKGNSEYLNTTLMLPDNYNSSQLSAIGNLSLDIGQKLKIEDFKLNVSLKSQFNEKDKNIIYVGGLKNTTSDFLNLLTKDEKEKANESAVVKQVASPFNKDKKMLLIISDNDSALENAIRLISSNNLINTLNSSSVIVDKNKDVLDIKENNSNNIDLKNLGYGDILLKGPFSQETNFDIDMPKNKVSTSGSKFNLNFRYSKNLDFERSLVTVYVNNTPISSKKLSMANADNDSLEVILPSDVLGKNYYQIKVVFNLELKDFMCVTRDSDNPWAYILDSSFAEFDYKDNNNLNFKYYPYPFINNGEANNLNIVVPKELNSQDLSNIANIVAYMGRDTKYNTGKLKILNDEEFSSENKNGNLIIIGTPSENKALQDINNDLYIRFNKSFTGFENNKKIKFIDDSYSRQLSTIQLIKSPYDKSNNVMIVSSIDKNSLSSSIRYLSDINLAKTMTGDAIVINRDGTIQDLNFKEIKGENDEDNKDKQNDFKIDKEGKIFIGVAGFLFITILISTILLVLKYRK